MLSCLSVSLLFTLPHLALVPFLSLHLNLFLSFSSVSLFLFCSLILSFSSSLLFYLSPLSLFFLCFIFFIFVLSLSLPLSLCSRTPTPKGSHTPSTVASSKKEVAAAGCHLKAWVWLCHIDTTATFSESQQVTGLPWCDGRGEPPAFRLNGRSLVYREEELLGLSMSWALPV